MRSRTILTNWRGEQAPVEQVYLAASGARGMPVGVGECCATKLVAEAHRQGWQRLDGIAEVWVGKSTRRRVEDGALFDACEARCQQVLGFMLCGAAGVD